MAAHSRFGGSIADRYMNCAGSTALVAAVPPKPSGPYALEGTHAHALGEYALRNDHRSAAEAAKATTYFHEAEDGTLTRVTFSEEMCKAVQVYLDAVFAELDSTADAELFVEQKFELDVPSAAKGEVFGQNDAMVYHPSTGRLAVFDYKHGAGVSVGVEDSAQLKFYAAGAIFSNPTWKLSEVELVVVQPRDRSLDRLDDDDPEKTGIKCWPLPLHEILEFMGELDKAILAAKEYEAELVILQTDLLAAGALTVGSWCRWCDAGTVCPARQKAILDAACLDFADIAEITVNDLPEPKTLDTERLAKLLAGGKLLNDWLNQAQEYVEALLLAGTAVPGWKVVEKIGRRKFIAADSTVVDYVDMMYGLQPDQVYPRHLVTLTELLKFLKAAGATKEQIEEFQLAYTIKESSGLTIAPASDKRPAVDAVATALGSVNIDAPT